LKTIKYSKKKEKREECGLERRIRKRNKNKKKVGYDI
jgi:hypothetical protein